MAAIRRCEKQQGIEAHVMERIRAGRLKPGDKAPSNVELARRFGVSTVTATTALSALAARGLVERRRGAGGTVVSGRLGRMGTVAFVMPPFMASFFWRIFIGAADVLTARGYATCFLDATQTFGGKSVWMQVAESGLDGVISVQVLPPVELPMPTVLVDYASAGPCPYPTVDGDDEGGGYLMGRHLMEAGHRDVAFLSGTRDVIPTRRAQGFLRALSEHGVKQGQHRVFGQAGRQADIPALVYQALRKYPRLTAIAAATDTFAADVLRILAREKIRVPADVSVAGFGNLTEMYTLQRFTTIDSHPAQYGIQAATLLADWIAHPDRRPDSVVIPGNLIPGDTVAVLCGAGPNRSRASGGLRSAGSVGSPNPLTPPASPRSGGAGRRGSSTDAAGSRG